MAGNREKPEEIIAPVREFGRDALPGRRFARQICCEGLSHDYRNAE
jgi:hypothetical protein